MERFQPVCRNHNVALKDPLVFLVIYNKVHHTTQSYTLFVNLMILAN